MTSSVPSSSSLSSARSGQQVLRAGAAGPAGSDGTVLDVTPESAGWSFSGLRVVELSPGATHRLDLVGCEALVLPLAGRVRADVDGAVVDLAGRPDVFAGPSDSLFLGRGSTALLTAVDGASARVAVATARASRTLPTRYIPVAEVSVELRGAGSTSRRVTGYTLGTDVAVDRLLVCEVLTPGGNWSSYPPHKHDVHSAEERVLEEIYYFEVAPAPAAAGGTPGIGYHRVYGTEGRPADVLEEVRTGDVVLVPHGYHGPSMAAPGYDLFYLNVMAGPADDGRWLSTDDPDHAWIRSTWPAQPVDPRLLPPGA